MKKISIQLLKALLLAFVFVLIPTKEILAIDLTEFIARPDFVPHGLSTGEFISFTAEGGPGPGNPARQLKGGNYEQFFYSSSGVFRREDTSWAPKPGFGDALCTNTGQKAIYTLYPGCRNFSTGETITGDGALWAPANVNIGQTWSTQTHQIVTFDDAQNKATGNRIYCPIDISGYNDQAACGQSAGLKLEAFYPANTFTFCSGIKNAEDLVLIRGISGPGNGDTFYYMKGWGLMGFEAPGFQAGPLGEGADGTLCKGGVNSASPFTGGNSYVPCNETRDPEFHSLRPYPASPCDVISHEQALMCGNDLITKQTFEVTPEQANSCSTQADGSRVCSYEFESKVGINIQFNASELPILGNTELVPNSTSPYSGNFGLNPTQRVNEYVSWYLNGINNRAEEPDLDKIDPMGSPSVVYGEAESIYRLINFSGPLNKLLPWRVLVEKRFQTVKNAFDSVTASAGIRHNQIVGCILSDIFGVSGDPTECYKGTGIVKRLVDWMPVSGDTSNIPPAEEAFASVPEYWQQYIAWRGGFCSSYFDFIPQPGGFYGCVGLLRLFFADIFPYVPLSSTEDRVGAGIIRSSGAGPSAGGNQVEVTDIELTFPSDSPFDVLFYPHTVEVSELSALLQNTFIPLTGRGFAVGLDSERPFIPPNCEVVDSRSNPGDDLYGEKEEFLPFERRAEGEISYTARFDCIFPPPQNQTCLDLCFANPESFGYPQEGEDINALCNQKCTQEPKCEKTALTASIVEISMPKAEEIWQRLVKGPMSVVKRFYPKLGPDSPIDKFEPIPGQSLANYSAIDGGSTLPLKEGGAATALAGNPLLNRPGTSANIYFPFVGGVHEYFLRRLQDALRPKGYQSFGIGPAAGIPETLSCTLDGTGIASQKLLGIIAAAAKWANVPVQVLVATVQGEACQGGGTLCTDDDSIIERYSQPGAAFEYNCIGTGGVNLDPQRAYGPMQFYPTLWGQFKDAVNMATGELRTPNICNIKDSIYAAAYTLSAAFDGCANPGHNVSSTPPASNWTVEDMKRSLSAWAQGCNTSACTLDAGKYYCSLIDDYLGGKIQTTCNQ